MDNIRVCWVSWEAHRRSRVLADHFNITLYEIISSKKSALRYLECCFRTYRVIREVKPTVLVVQNPSIVLALLASLLKYVYRYKLIVDRHTNFKFAHRKSKNPKWVLFRIISNVTIKIADLTIVTNKGLARVVKKQGGNTFVLPDKIPSLRSGRTKNISINKDRKNVLYICSFSQDEPVEKVIQAFIELDDSWHLYVSGNWRRLYNKTDLESVPKNITLTGFVDDDEYNALLSEVDYVIVLTKNEFTLTCGAYEALSVNKPVLLSKTLALKRYFKDTCVFTDIETVQDIVSGIERLEKFGKIPSDERKRRIDILDEKWCQRSRGLSEILEVYAT